MSACWPMSRALAMSCIVKINCDSHDRLGLKPCCASEYFESTKVINHLGFVYSFWTGHVSLSEYRCHICSVPIIWNGGCI